MIHDLDILLITPSVLTSGLVDGRVWDYTIRHYVTGNVDMRKDNISCVVTDIVESTYK